LTTLYYSKKENILKTFKRVP